MMKGMEFFYEGLNNDNKKTMYHHKYNNCASERSLERKLYDVMAIRK